MRLKLQYINIAMLFIGLTLAFPYFFDGGPSLFKYPEESFHTFLGMVCGFYLLIYPGLKKAEK